MGGNTRHFLTLYDDLRRDDRFHAETINTSRGFAYRSRLRNASVGIRTLLAIVRRLHRVDVVSYHASNRGMLVFGPLVVLLGKITRTAVVLRIFGGSFGDLYENSSPLRRLLIRRVILSADIVLLQTKRSIDQLAHGARGRLEWFSTYIRRPERPQKSRRDAADAGDDVCRRFVFLGHLRRVKGIDEILAAAEGLPDAVRIDLFGPLDEYSESEIEERGRGIVRYRGFLTHEEVDQRLWDYDCLLLPTYHASEGYPGVIAEAYAHGIPVISTRWLAIPEIVDETCGILIEPRDADGLRSAISDLHDKPERWRALRGGASRRAAEFDHTVWSERFAELCISLGSTDAP